MSAAAREVRKIFRFADKLMSETGLEKEVKHVDPSYCWTFEWLALRNSRS